MRRDGVCDGAHCSWWAGAAGWSAGFRTPLATQFALYVIVAVGAAGLLWCVMWITHLPLIWSALISLTVLAVLNTVINRISTFSSSTLAMVEYEAMGETFYDDQTDPKKVNWFRAWFHRSRYERLTQFVDRHYKPGATVADAGCGNCWWNIHSYPVIGIDVNERNVTTSDTLGNTSVHDTSKVAEIKERYRAIRAKIGERTRQDRRISQELYAKYGKREKNRTVQVLHCISTKIVECAKKNNLGIVMEKLKGIRRLYRRGMPKEHPTEAV